MNVRYQFKGLFDLEKETSFQISSYYQILILVGNHVQRMVKLYKKGNYDYV